jgi:hypothetical protein
MSKGAGIELRTLGGENKKNEKPVELPIVAIPEKPMPSAPPAPLDGKQILTQRSLAEEFWRELEQARPEHFTAKDFVNARERYDFRTICHYLYTDLKSSSKRLSNGFIYDALIKSLTVPIPVDPKLRTQYDTVQLLLATIYHQQIDLSDGQRAHWFQRHIQEQKTISKDNLPLYAYAVSNIYPRAYANRVEAAENIKQLIDLAPGISGVLSIVKRKLEEPGQESRWHFIKAKHLSSWTGGPGSWSLTENSGTWASIIIQAQDKIVKIVESAERLVKDKLIDQLTDAEKGEVIAFLKRPAIQPGIFGGLISSSARQAKIDKLCSRIEATKHDGAVLLTQPLKVTLGGS